VALLCLAKGCNSRIIEESHCNALHFGCGSSELELTFVFLVLPSCLAVGKDTFDTSLKCLDYLGWMVSFGNASGKPEPLDLLRCVRSFVRKALSRTACPPAWHTVCGWQEDGYACW